MTQTTQEGKSAVERLLEVIAKHPGSNRASLIARSGIANPSGYLNRMMKDGLVFRYRGDSKFLYFISQEAMAQFIKDGEHEDSVDTEPPHPQVFNIPNLPTWGVRNGAKFRCD